MSFRKLDTFEDSTKMKAMLISTCLAWAFVVNLGRIGSPEILENSNEAVKCLAFFMCVFFQRNGTTENSEKPIKKVSKNKI